MVYSSQGALSELTNMHVYHLLKPFAACCNGHSAVIIPHLDQSHSLYTWYWQGILCFGVGKLYSRNFPTLEDALGDAKSDGFSRQQYWPIAPEHIPAAHDAARAYALPTARPYDSLRNNCWHLALAVLRAANIPVRPFTPIPNVNFLRNARHASASSQL